MANEVEKKTETGPVAKPPVTPPPDIRIGGRVQPFLPQSLDEVIRYSRMLLVAGAVPDALSEEKGRKLPEREIISRVVAVIAAGSEVGLAPMSAMASIAIINRKRYIFGEGAIALVQNSGQLESMEREFIGTVPEDDVPTGKFHDSFGVRVTLKRRGQDRPYIGSYTVGQAKRAHLWLSTVKRTWTEAPEAMLFWRAFHQAAVAGFSDFLNGMGIRELAQEEPVETTPIATNVAFLDGPKPPVQEPPTGDRTEPEPEPFPEEPEDEREDGEP